MQEKHNHKLKVLAINSLPTIGNAGLKMVTGILSNRVNPVPTLLLSGTGNMEGHQRFPVPFRQLLAGSLALAKENQEQLILYIGYLGDPEQAKVILENIALFREIICFVVVDPVCGDNGKAYVPDGIMAAWHELLPHADLATPNITELALLSGHLPPFQLQEPAGYVKDFQKKYPSLPLVVTGIIKGGTLINLLLLQEEMIRSIHPYVPHYYSGAGDTYSSLFIYYHFYKGFSTIAAFRKAGEMMEEIIEDAWRTNYGELRTYKWTEYLQQIDSTSLSVEEIFARIKVLSTGRPL